MTLGGKGTIYGSEEIAVFTPSCVAFFIVYLLYRIVSSVFLDPENLKSLKSFIWSLIYKAEFYEKLVSYVSSL